MGKIRSLKIRLWKGPKRTVRLRQTNQALQQNSWVGSEARDRHGKMQGLYVLAEIGQFTQFNNQTLKRLQKKGTDKPTNISNSSISIHPVRKKTRMEKAGIQYLS